MGQEQFLFELAFGSRIGGSLLIFLSLLASALVVGLLKSLALLSCQPVWLACWIDSPERSSSSVSRAVQDAWGFYREELGVVPPDVVLALRYAVSRSCVDVFFLSGARVLRPVFLVRIVWLRLAALLFLEEVCYIFVVGVLEAELLEAEVLVGLYRSSLSNEVDVQSVQYFVNSCLAPSSSFVGVLSPLLMCSGD